VAGVRRRLHNEEFRNLYAAPGDKVEDVCVRHVARMGDKCVQNFWAEDLKGRGLDEGIILE